MASVKTLLEFLDDRLLSIPEGTTSSCGYEPRQESQWRSNAAVHSIQPTTACKLTCTLCNGERHALYLCSSFKSLSLDQMNSHIRTNKLCFNCLGTGHQTNECRCLSRCKLCSGKHHTLLHRDEAISSGPVETPDTVDPATVQVTANYSMDAIQPTLMMTRQITLEGPSGHRSSQLGHSWTLELPCH